MTENTNVNASLTNKKEGASIIIGFKLSKTEAEFLHALAQKEGLTSGLFSRKIIRSILENKAGAANE